MFWIELFKVSHIRSHVSCNMLDFLLDLKTKEQFLNTKGLSNYLQKHLMNSRVSNFVPDITFEMV